MAGYKPVIEYCGGTEIGGGFLTGTMVQPQAPSHFSTPSIGSRLALINDQQVLFDSLTGDSKHSCQPLLPVVRLLPSLHLQSARAVELT